MRKIVSSTFGVQLRKKRKACGLLYISRLVQNLPHQRRAEKEHPFPPGMLPHPPVAQVIADFELAMVGFISNVLGILFDAGLSRVNSEATRDRFLLCASFRMILACAAIDHVRRHPVNISATSIDALADKILDRLPS